MFITKLEIIKQAEQKHFSLAQVWKDFKHSYKTLKKSQSQLKNMEDPSSLICKPESKAVFHILVISQKLHLSQGKRKC